MSNDVSVSTQKSLVLILGAGASCEANLPLGEELIKRIGAELSFKFDDFGRFESGNGQILTAFEELAKKQNEISYFRDSILAAAKRIRETVFLAPSIDNFMDSNREDPEIQIAVKLAIAHCILEAESKSLLVEDNLGAARRPNFGGLKKTWYVPFFQRLVENCAWPEVPSRLEKIAVISFNYDRCFEHYLYHALQAYFGVSEKEAEDALRSLMVFHPYGQVGALPWQGEGGSIPFGEVQKSTGLLFLLDRIKTFTESIDHPKQRIASMRAIVARARRVLFLGSAFHRQNLSLLSPGDPDPRHSGLPGRVLGTAFEISDDDCAGIRGQICEGFRISEHQVVLEQKLTCAAMVRDYGRSLYLGD